MTNHECVRTTGGCRYLLVVVALWRSPVPFLELENV